MNAKNRSILVPVSGLFAGGVAAAIVTLPSVPKAAVVFVVAASVAALAGVICSREQGG